MRASRIAPWAAASVIAAGFACSIALSALAPSYAPSAWQSASWLVIVAASSATGLVLAVRRRESPIGWLLLANGLVLTWFGLAEAYAKYAVLAHPDALPGGEWAVLLSERPWPLLFACMTAIAFVFPDGRLPSPRWRWVAVAGASSFAALTLLALLGDEPFSEQFERVSSPLPELSAPVVELLTMLSILGALATLVAGALAVRTRSRRATGVERLQVRWLAYAAVLLPAIVVTCLVEVAITGNDGSATMLALVLALTAIPVAIGIAVMRYRLYEIDRLINRTLVYLALSAALAATYASVSLLLGVAIGAGSTLPTAAATLAVAVLFRPLRGHVQLLVDRRFDRARYEALRKVNNHLEELRAGRVAPEATGSVLADALGDPCLELFFWLPAGELHVDASGRALAPLRDPGRARTPVRRGDLPLATVVHDKALGERPDLLESVIGAAGLAIEIARLRVEVRQRLAEVEESRARIVTAGYEERRRLERDLHDGAQQRLVSIGLALRHVQSRLAAGSAEAAALDGIVAELARGIEELRELARGVRPAALDDGLGAALRELASRSQLRTSVDATEERFEGRVETAAFFVASEALANATKHARASRVTLSAARQNGTLVVSVSDDGVGGALPAQGSGLAGITDRVAALGGSVTVASPRGEGTVVTAELPCG